MIAKLQLGQSDNCLFALITPLMYSSGDEKAKSFTKHDIVCFPASKLNV